MQVKYFGMIAEWAGTDESSLELKGASIEGLKAKLEHDIPLLRGITYQVAVNQSIALPETTLNENDEVALLPPFAGG